MGGTFLQKGCVRTAIFRTYFFNYKNGVRQMSLLKPRPAGSPMLAALLFAVLVLLPTAASSGGLGGELSGYVSLEARLFADSPLFNGQDFHGASIAFQPEYYIERVKSLGGASLTFVPFGRLDSADTGRTHFDVRELFALRVFDDWELAVGARKIFWGVTESAHLVDIINQTDLVEGIDGEDKLGQPMISVSIPGESYTLDLFLMPWFRERTFPGRGGRLRSSRVVDTGMTEYESGAEEFHPDLALRYSRTSAEWDLGLTVFSGTGREPTLRKGTDSNGNDIFIPRYVQIVQGGMDLQWTGTDWIWKLEAIAREGQGGGGDTFGSWALGFEYTFYNIRTSGIDIGILAEWLHDTRGDAVPFDDDVFGGLRLAFNDAAGSEALAGVVQDLDTGARSVFFESSRRFSDHLRATLEARLFNGQPASDPAYFLRDDDFIQLEMAYWF